MNSSELNSRNSRKIEIGGDLAALHREKSQHTRQEAYADPSPDSPAAETPAALTPAPASVPPTVEAIPAAPRPTPSATPVSAPEPPVAIAPAPDTAPLGVTSDDMQHFSDEIAALRHAIALLLARETGQDIAIFESPVVNSNRLCAIAANIHERRHWAA